MRLSAGVVAPGAAFFRNALSVLAADWNFSRRAADPDWPSILQVPGRYALHASSVLHYLDDLEDGRSGFAILRRTEPGINGFGVRIALDLSRNANRLRAGFRDVHRCVSAEGADSTEGRWRICQQPLLPQSDWNHRKHGQLFPQQVAFP